jgi:hypothetical protein
LCTMFAFRPCANAAAAPTRQASRTRPVLWPLVRRRADAEAPCANPSWCPPNSLDGHILAAYREALKGEFAGRLHPSTRHRRRHLARCSPA